MTSLLKTLEKRFLDNMTRHPDADWNQVLARLEAHPDKLDALQAMEDTGGEPDVVRLSPSDEVTFFDCAEESPNGRRSLCYDQAALESRKEHPPKGSAIATAQSMGIQLLSEDDYQFLQSLGEFDLKTSSWLSTPAEVRELGGAIFGDRRYNRVFIFHNGADSYYAARGFRGSIRI